MNIEELRDYCLSIKGSVECVPFDENTLVYKVMDKMFAYFSLNPKDGDFWVSLKCDPEKSIELRERYQGIRYAYHAGKTVLSWNAVYLESDVPNSLLKELIVHSRDEVIRNLSRKKQSEYDQIP
ncbi:MAG: MmcQ/YjbR family DNA-binding protein [Tannerella sp.]|nr:MmcQ/YjbR family DNA-binding protein [Tannerella sp.]